VEEATLWIARLLVLHVAREKLWPLVDRLKDAPGHLAVYVQHLARSIPIQVLSFLKSYFPKALVVAVAGGVTTDCLDEQFRRLMEETAPITEQVAEKLNPPVVVLVY
jgi:hypothetical protein